MLTTLTQKSSKLTVEHTGARKILELNGEKILTKITRGDGKTGSTHPCTPIFGPDRNNLYVLNQHGDTRNQPTKVTKTSDNQITITHQINDQGYPSGVTIEQILTLSHCELILKTNHSNSGQKPTFLNYGEHCYFDAPKGFQGTKLNNQDLTDMIKNHKDGVPLPLKPKNTITIPGKPTITLTQKNMNHCMIWVGTSPDLRTKDSNYICIEPVEHNPNSDFFGSADSQIKPSQNRMVEFSIRLA